MGAWGTGSFQNDDAHDWVNKFCDAPSLAMIRETLEVVAKSPPDEDLEMQECASAIGAAEVVAALNGSPHADLPDDVAAWVGENRSSVRGRFDLVDLASRALNRAWVDDSEMKDSWLTDELRLRWQADLIELESRLAGISAG